MIERYRFLQNQIDIITLALVEAGSINEQLKQQAVYAEKRMKEREREKSYKVQSVSGKK